MDSRAITDGCPTGNSWLALDEATKRTWAIKLIERALVDLKRSGTQPDGWESSDLASAIGAIWMRCYALAITNVGSALVPEEGRGHTRALQQFTVAQLDEYLHDAIVGTADHS